MATPIPLTRPFIDDTCRRLVLEVLDSGQLTDGAVTRELEAAFRAYVGARHAVAVTSCSTGLEVALRALGVGPGDEVVVPDYTFPATAMAAALAGATAVIVDCRADDMLVDPDRLEAAIGPRTKAIVPVSLFGNPLPWDRIDDIRRRRGVAVVEDAACAIGATYRGRRTGTFADVTVFSLHPRKFVTTGEGGVIATDRDDLAAWMDSYKRFGMRKAADRHETVFEMTGTNLKLTNLQAAIGVAQMRRIDELLAARRAQAARYAGLLAGDPRVAIPATTAGGEHSYQSFCVHVPDRARVMDALRGEGIEAQIGTHSLHMHPAFRTDPRYRLNGPFPGSARIQERCLALPLYHGLSATDQERVAGRLLELLPRP